MQPARLDDQAFGRKFVGSPIKRSGRNRFVRNVLCAIGNSEDASLLTVAEDLAGDADPAVADAVRCLKAAPGSRAGTGRKPNRM